MGDKQTFIQTKARESLAHQEGQKVLWSRHALAKLIVENLSRQEVEGALASCEVIDIRLNSARYRTAWYWDGSRPGSPFMPSSP